MHALHELRVGSEALLALIGDLYEGPLEAAPWQSFAEGLRVTFAARNVAVTLHHGAGQVFDTYVMAAESGDNTDWGEVESVYRQRFMGEDPKRLESLRPGEILNLAIEDRPPAFNSYLASCNIGDTLRTSFAEPGGMRCWIDIVRPREPRAPFGTAEVGLLRLLLPHLTRALRLYSGQKRQEAEKALYEETMDHFALGTVLLDGELRILRLNRAASAIISAHPGIRIEGARLRLADFPQRAAFHAALGRALAAARVPGHRGAGGELLRIEQPDGRPLGLLVHPLAQARYYRGTHAPSLVVYMTDVAGKLDALEPACAASQALIAQLFGLTPQQARLALLLADGCTLSAAAERMGIAESAARSYSKRMYATMGIGSQSDIVRLVYRSFALLR